jgi:hypothetical protein
LQKRDALHLPCGRLHRDYRTGLCRPGGSSADHRVIAPRDFFVDASSRGALTLELLDKVGLPKPQETEIGIDLQYATAIFQIPPSAVRDWRAVLHRPDAQSGRGGLLVPIENNRWQVNLTCTHGEPVPKNIGDFIPFAKTLRTQTIHDAIKDAVPIGPIYRFGFPCSIRRRFDTLETSAGKPTLAFGVSQSRPLGATVARSPDPASDRGDRGRRPSPW